MTDSTATMPKGPCSVCGGHIVLTKLGLVRQHRTRRVDRRGRAYSAADLCLGSGEPPTPMDGA